MQDAFKASLGQISQVKLKQSQRQTKLFIVLKGSPKITDDILKRIHQVLITLKPQNPA